MGEVSLWVQSSRLHGQLNNAGYRLAEDQAMVSPSSKPSEKIPRLVAFRATAEIAQYSEALKLQDMVVAPLPKASFFLPLLVFVSWERVLIQQPEHPQEIPLILERILAAVVDTMDIPPQFRGMIAIDEQTKDTGLYRSHQVSPSSRKFESSWKTH